MNTGRRIRFSTAIIYVVATAIGLAQTLKAVHIDDALYLSIARHVAKHPLDPYGGMIYWQQQIEPTYRVSISPPLVNYYDAIPFAILGDRCDESIVKLFRLPWFWLLAFGLDRLGRRFANGEPWPALLILATPNVVVGSNLMLDTPLAAAFAASLACWFNAEDDLGRRRSTRYALAGALAVLAVLIKYVAVASILLYLLGSIIRRRPVSAVSWLAPLIAFGLWQWFSAAHYGASQVSQGSGFLRQFGRGDWSQTIERCLTSLMLIGASSPIWLAASLYARGRWVWIPVALIVGFGTSLYQPEKPGPSPADRRVRRLFNMTTAAGVVSTGSALSAIVKRRRDEQASQFSVADDRATDVDLRMLALAFVGFTAFVTMFGPFVALRSVFPATIPMTFLIWSSPPAAIGRSTSAVRFRSFGFMLALGVCSIVSAALFESDRRWANVYPALAKRIKADARFQNKPTYFVGHWGWQHYLEREGFKPIPSTGDVDDSSYVVLAPALADPQPVRFPPNARFERLEGIETEIASPLGRLGPAVWRRPGVRFYGGDFGETPFAIEPQPAERIDSAIVDIR